MEHLTPFRHASPATIPRTLATSAAGSILLAKKDLWPDRPHHTPGAGPTSLVAALLAWGDAPAPATGDAANDGTAAAPEFARFLDSHGFRLTPLAAIYLGGTSDAGPEPVDAVTRHASGLQAVMRAVEAGHEDLAIELPGLDAANLPELLTADGLDVRLRQVVLNKW